MTRYILLLGGNMGDPERALAVAREYIDSMVGKIVASSPTMWTPPVGKGVTADFLNQALIVETILDPEALIDILESIERKMGRNKPSVVDWNVEDRVYSDRIIDIDIAYVDFYGGNEFKGEWHSERLSIPHREIGKRGFVGQLVSKIV